MNDKQVRNLIKDLGAFTEIWAIIYSNFLSFGYSEMKALLHTKVFFEALMAVSTSTWKENHNDMSSM